MDTDLKPFQCFKIINGAKILPTEGDKKMDDHSKHNRGGLFLELRY